MSEKKNDILLSVEENKMSNKYYELLPLAATHLMERKVVDNVVMVPKKVFRAYLKHKLHKTYYMIDKVIDTYLCLGVLEEQEDYYIIAPVTSNFVGLPVATIIYFLDHLSDMAFKVYCYLLAKYNINQTYHLPTFRFSKKQVLEGIGLSRCQENLYKLNEILNILEQLDLIKYNHTPHYVEGMNGRYMELYWVKKYANAQMTSAKEWAQNESIDSLEVLTKVSLPGVELSEENQKKVEQLYVVNGNKKVKLFDLS